MDFHTAWKTKMAMTEQEKLELKTYEAKLSGKTYPVSRFLADADVYGPKSLYQSYLKNEKGSSSLRFNPGKSAYLAALVGGGLGATVGALLRRKVFSTGTAAMAGLGALISGSSAALNTALSRSIARRAVAGASVLSPPQKKVALGKKLRGEDR